MKRILLLGLAAGAAYLLKNRHMLAELFNENFQNIGAGRKTSSSGQNMQGRQP